MLWASLFILLVGILILVGVLLALSPGKPYPIVDANGKPVPGSLSEKIWVNINGMPQGMFIQSKDPTNPVLLVLHGGPGMPEYWLTKQYPTGLEAYFTALIELLWPKQRIIEVYLNIAEFGDGIYGAGAASAHFFRNTPAQLNPRQCALLAAVLPNPRKLHVEWPSAYVQRRANWIERQVRQLGGADWLEP